MIHLNMTVEIDVCADDVWGEDVSWLETEVMHKLENKMLDLFDYPISANAKLQDYNIDGDDEIIEK